ncbi:MAG: GntR family transcriptional regulator [Lentisphaeria bacterium]
MAVKNKIIPRIEFETNSPVPLYYQLSTGIQKYLRKHRFAAGAALISERALADCLKLSRNTVRKAYSSLQEEEVIERLPGGRNIYITKKFEESYGQESYPTIGLVLCDKMAWLIRNQKFEVLDYVSGVIDTAGEFGFAATVIPLPPVNESPTKLRAWFDDMRGYLSGLIYLGDREGEYHDKAFQVMLAETSIPQVFVGGKSQLEHVGSVTVDAVSGMVSAIEYLLELQHKKIGLVFKKVPKRRYMQLQSFHRYDDALEAMNKCNVEVCPEYVINDFQDIASLEKKITKILRLKNRPSAFLCFNDWVAMQVIEICKKLNLNVPDDISVIGYDDNYLAAEFNPPLTTIKHPRYLLGKNAVKMIAESRRLQVPVIQLNAVLPTNLIIRGCTAAKRENVPVIMTE